MQLIKKKWLPELSYVLKCLSGVSICYILYIAFPKYPFFWAIISVVLAISPDNSNQQAYDRMKANLLGCAVGLGLYFLHLPSLLTLCLGIFIVIFIGTALKIPAASPKRLVQGPVVIPVDEDQQPDKKGGMQ
jgi:uncharacterized membrane protein YgaE (UPF0421/DUF939 family)